MTDWSERWNVDFVKRKLVEKNGREWEKHWRESSDKRHAGLWVKINAENDRDFVWFLKNKCSQHKTCNTFAWTWLFCPHAFKTMFLTFSDGNLHVYFFRASDKIILQRISCLCDHRRDTLTSLPSCLCRSLRLLDLRCGSWGTVPMELLSQIYGILGPAQVVRRRRVSSRHHNGARKVKIR